MALSFGGTAAQGEDYTAGTETLTLPAGAAAAATTVTAVDDAVNEDAETIVIAAAVDGETVGEAQTIVIADDDAAAVVVAPTALQVEEGGGGEYTVVLAGPPSGPVEIAVTVAAGTDVTVSPPTLTFPAAAWSSAQTVTVRAGEDDDAAGDEATLTHAVRGGGYDGATASDVTVTVIDDDASPVGLTLAAEPAEVSEGAGATALTVTAVLSDARAADTTVSLEVLAGTASSEADYRATGAGLTIAAGETRGTAALTLTPVDDAEDEPDETVTVSGRSGDLGVAPATVTILDDDEPNRPPAFPSEGYRLELEENRAGRPGPLALGAVTAADPDGDPLTYALTSGPRDRFAVDAQSGAVAYVGPGEDFEGGASGYALRVEARDSEGLSAEAGVVVTVLDVAEAPVAAAIPAQALDEGGGPVTLELSAYFTDGDGDALRYEASSANEAAATVSVSGSTLTLTAAGRGEALVTVTARDPGGLSATQSFGVMVSDRWVRVVAENALAAQARGHLSSARMTLGRRAESFGGGLSRVTVAGQAVPLGSPDTAGMWLGSPHSWQLRETAARYRLAAFDPTGVLARPGPAASVGGLSPLGGLGSYGGGMEHALLGSDFLLSGAGGQDEPGGGGRGRRWTVWGQGDLQTFRGGPVGTPLELGYDGDLRTWYLGVDEALGERWLLGVALARSEGGGAWRAGSASGRLSSAMTVVHPYLRWGRGDTTVWTLLGVGRGAMSNVRTANGVEETSGLGLSMGLVEARRRLATVGGGVRLGLRGEASWAGLSTDAGDETVDALRAEVNRGRVGLEVDRELAAGGLRLAPFGAVSARRDGGAGQTGTGLEVAGGLRLTGGRVRVEAQGRRLVLHTASGYQEQGASVTARVGAGPQAPGLSLTLSPRWGAPGYGADSLWQDHVYEYGPGFGRAGRAFDAQVGYGLELGGGALVTPFGGYGQAPYGRRVHLGALVGGRGPSAGPVQMELRLDRAGRSGAAAYHRLSLMGVVSFGDEAPSRRPEGTGRRDAPRFDVRGDEAPPR